MNARAQAATVRVLIPIYEDWEAVAALLRRLDEALTRAGWRADVLVVDDCSVARPNDGVAPDGPAALARVRSLRLRRNLGHQRAIAVGMAFLEQEDPASGLPVLVMDGDGEDDPGDAVTLLQRFVAEGAARAVFAGRARRSEGLAFRAGYQLFKVLHRLLTGQGVRVGNFSVLPASALRQLVAAPELWNHFAASVFKLRLPRVIVPIARSTRLAGASAMSWVGLVVHGLSAISVFGDVVGVRLLLGTAALAAATALALVGACCTPDAFDPGVVARLTPALGLALMGLSLAVLVELTFVLLLLSSRGNAVLLPVRDHGFFHLGAAQLHPPPADEPA